MNYRKSTSNFPLTWLAIRQWHFWQANHNVYSNLSTHIGALNKDFDAVNLQMDLTNHIVLVPSVVQAKYDSRDNMTFKTGNDIADF